MEVTLYLAPSLNGMITDSMLGTRFVSKSDWMRFAHLAKEYGNAVFGRKTFEDIVSAGELASLTGVKLFVATRQPISNRQRPGEHGPFVEFVSGGPKKILDLVGEQGFANCLLGGGSELNSSFASANLIDRVLVDLQPWLLGDGKPMFLPADFRVRLRLGGVRRLSDDEVQLTYEVIR